MTFEYKVVPAPVKGVKARGVKSGPDRFAHALETVMNDLARDGWEYQRTDTLPCEEREGLMGKTTVFQHVLVFRRPLAARVADTPQVTKALPAPTQKIKETQAAPTAAQKSDPQDRAEPRLAAE